MHVGCLLEVDELFGFMGIFEVQGFSFLPKARGQSYETGPLLEAAGGDEATGAVAA